MRFAVRPDQEIGPQLEHIGIAPRAGSAGWCSRTCTPTTPAGSPHFPNAEILVARKEYEAA